MTGSLANGPAMCLSTLQIYPEQLGRRITTVTEGLAELLTMDP
jgi:hypothetical protein